MATIRNLTYGRILRRLPAPVFRLNHRSNGNLRFDHVKANNEGQTRRTKIICTLGPACWSVDGLVNLIDNGMNIARFNFSHGDHAGHFATLERLRTAIAQRPGARVGVMLDTKGPEIRTGNVDPTVGSKVKYEKGQVIEVGTDYTRPCTNDHLACSYKSLPTSVQPGSKILVADGSMSLKVTECRPTSVLAEVLNTASFGSHKNMNLPGAVVDLPTLTEKDIDDLVNWGVRHEVDFIAASFVRCGQDIDNIRTVLGEAGKDIKIIAKIENQQGLQNFDEILTKTDGIMVARGDLGMEIPIEKVFIAQKMMIHKSNLAGKPVVTATQMLESMITNPRPTRAECADVANAVLDGSDCVMLSGETANGEFPNEAVRMMASTCVEAESLIDYDKQYDYIRHAMLDNDLVITSGESLASSAVKTARDLNAKVIIVLTESGNTARLVAKYRPTAPILALTRNEHIARQMNGYLKNTFAEVIVESLTLEELVAKAIADAKRLKHCVAGDTVVVLHGSKAIVSGTVSFLRVATA
eukprot:gene11677-8318_t